MDTSKPLITRKTNNDLDVVTTELKKGFEWTTKHTTLILGLLVTFVILGGGYAAYNMVTKKNEVDLQAKYYDLEAVVNKKRADFEQAKNPMPAQPGEPVPAVTAKPTGDIAKDYGDVTAGLADFAKSHPASAAGAMAALNLASLQAEYNQTDSAIETLKGVSVQKSFLGALVQMELATQLANASKCPEAQAIWESLVGQTQAAFLKAEAKLKMGLCAESTGDIARAQGYYKEVEMEFKESAAGRSAAQYLRLLSSKTEAPKSN